MALFQKNVKIASKSCSLRPPYCFHNWLPSNGGQSSPRTGNLFPPFLSLLEKKRQIIIDFKWSNFSFKKLFTIIRSIRKHYVHITHNYLRLKSYLLLISHSITSFKSRSYFFSLPSDILDLLLEFSLCTTGLWGELSGEAICGCSSPTGVVRLILWKKVERLGTSCSSSTKSVGSGTRKRAFLLEVFHTFGLLDSFESLHRSWVSPFVFVNWLSQQRWRLFSCKDVFPRVSFESFPYVERVSR